MKLTLLHTGLYAEGDGRAPFPAYLIQTDDGKNVLVDTGLNDQYVSQTVNAAGEHVIFQAEDEKILNQLHRLGLSAADIHYVVCTHFDEDHCGGNALFDRAEFIVQQSHYEEARLSQKQRYEVCRSYWDVAGLNYRQVSGDFELLPGIEIIVTDGHVPGHQSVLVRLPHTGAVLLPIDAMRDHRMLEPGIDPRTVSMFDTDGDKLLEGVRKFQEIIKREQVKLIVFNHDWPYWQTLRKAPEFYD